MKSESGAKTAKSDSSFFSAPKKKVLPSFKKVAPPAKKDEAVSQPLSFDPFQEAFNALTKGSGVGAATSTPPPTNAVLDANVADTVMDFVPSKKDPLRRKKSVTFPSDDALEAIRWIQRADYPDDDESEVSVLHGTLWFVC